MALRDINSDKFVKLPPEYDLKLLDKTSIDIFYSECERIESQLFQIQSNLHRSKFIPSRGASSKLWFIKITRTMLEMTSGYIHEWLEFLLKNGRCVENPFDSKLFNQPATSKLPKSIVPGLFIYLNYAIFNMLRWEGVVDAIHFVLTFSIDEQLLNEVARILNVPLNQIVNVELPFHLLCVIMYQKEFKLKSQPKEISRLHTVPLEQPPQKLFQHSIRQTKQSAQFYRVMKAHYAYDCKRFIKTTNNLPDIKEVALAAAANSFKMLSSSELEVANYLYRIDYFVALFPQLVEDIKLLMFECFNIIHNDPNINFSQFDNKFKNLLRKSPLMAQQLRIWENIKDSPCNIPTAFLQSNLAIFEDPFNFFSVYTFRDLRAFEKKIIYYCPHLDCTPTLLKIINAYKLTCSKRGKNENLIKKTDVEMNSTVESNAIELSDFEKNHGVEFCNMCQKTHYTMDDLVNELRNMERTQPPHQLLAKLIN